MKARYIGFQQGFDDIPGFKLFNIVAPGNPLNGTTVTEERLNELGIDPSKREYPLKGEKLTHEIFDSSKTIA